MLNEIQIQNFRNIPALEFSPSSKGNIIIAPNGRGKTNILESIHYCLTSSSFRPLSTNGEVVGPQNGYAKVTLKWEKSLIECIVRKADHNVSRRFLLNGKQTSIKKIIKSFPVILFAPHSVDLVSGDPANRREDLDRFLSSVEPNYHTQLGRYNQLLRNRNALLKIVRQGKANTGDLNAWTEQLVDTASYIFQTRYKFFQDIKDFIGTSAKEIYSDLDNLSVIYLPNTSSNHETYRNDLNEKFKGNIEKEILVGKTLYGPHKDDFIFKKDDFNLRYMGSRGQQRIGAFIFKIAQFKYTDEKIDNKALLLLDDVLSELDSNHRETLAKYISGNDYQFLLTSSDEREVPQEILSVSTRISLDSK